MLLMLSIVKFFICHMQNNYNEALVGTEILVPRLPPTMLTQNV